MIYILTQSNDNAEEYLKLNNIKYNKIAKYEFLHRLAREKNIYLNPMQFLKKDISEMELRNFFIGCGK